MGELIFTVVLISSLPRGLNRVAFPVFDLLSVVPSREHVDFDPASRNSCDIMFVCCNAVSTVFWRSIMKIHPPPRRGSALIPLFYFYLHLMPHGFPFSYSVYSFLSVIGKEMIFYHLL